MTPHGMAELTTKIWRENEIQTGELNVRSDDQNKLRDLRTQLSNPVGSIQPKVKTHFRRSIGSSFPPLTGDSYRPFSAIFLFAEPIGGK